MELATGFKITSTDRQKLPSVKQFGGLTIPPIKTCKQNPNAPLSKHTSTGSAIRILQPLKQKFIKVCSILQ